MRMLVRLPLIAVVATTYTLLTNSAEVAPPPRELPAGNLAKVVRALDAADAEMFLEAVREARAGGFDSTLLDLLTEKLRDPKVRDRGLVIYELGEYGAAAKKAVPHLVQLVQDPLSTHRHAAIHAISRVGPAAKEAVPVFQTLVHDTDPLVSIDSAWALWMITRDVDQTLAPLIHYLEDRNADIRKEAVAKLQGMGPPAKSATGKLVSLLKDDSESVRTQVCLALAKISGRDPRYIRVFLEQIPEAAGRERGELRFSLWWYGELAVPALVECLGSDKAIVRKRALWMLGDEGRKAISTLPQVQARSADDDADVRAAAREALGKLRRAMLEEPMK
jgi:HEAT repeat protein